MDIEFNNVSTIDTDGTGWVLGYSEWTKANIPGIVNLRHIEKGTLLQGLSVKWVDHKANDPSGDNKPLSEGRTCSLLVSETGKFRIEFSEDPSFSNGKTEKFCLENRGDFIIWGAGLYHRWFFDADTSILTVRWTPVETKEDEYANTT